VSHRCSEGEELAEKLWAVAAQIIEYGYESPHDFDHKCAEEDAEAVRHAADLLSDRSDLSVSDEGASDKRNWQLPKTVSAVPRPSAGEG
jgi:hypothetical protein